MTLSQTTTERRRKRTVQRLRLRLRGAESIWNHKTPNHKKRQKQVCTSTFCCPTFVSKYISNAHFHPRLVTWNDWTTEAWVVRREIGIKGRMVEQRIYFSLHHKNRQQVAKSPAYGLSLRGMFCGRFPEYDQVSYVMMFTEERPIVHSALRLLLNLMRPIWSIMGWERTNAQLLHAGRAKLLQYIASIKPPNQLQIKPCNW